VRTTALFVMLLVAAIGLGIGYFVYQQQQTKTVVIAAQAALAPTATGAQCGSVQFEVGPRTLGVWSFPAHDDTTVTGTLAIGGDSGQDVLFKIYTPHNRLVLGQAKRVHEQPFDLGQTVGGNYRFEFDNRHSTLTDKHVTLQVCVSSGTA
jgi:hypothetical protein